MVKCNVIQDLLPLYVDEVCSADTKEVVEEHLTTCEGCKSYFEQLKRDFVIEDDEIQNHMEDIELLKQGKKEISNFVKRELLKSFYISFDILFLIITALPIVMSVSVSSGTKILALGELGLLPILIVWVLLLIISICGLTLIVRKSKKKFLIINAISFGGVSLILIALVVSKFLQFFFISL